MNITPTFLTDVINVVPTAQVDLKFQGIETTADGGFFMAWINDAGINGTNQKITLLVPYDFTGAVDSAEPIFQLLNDGPLSHDLTIRENGEILFSTLLDDGTLNLDRFNGPFTQTVTYTGVKKQGEASIFKYGAGDTTDGFVVFYINDTVQASDSIAIGIAETGQPVTFATFDFSSNGGHENLAVTKLANGGFAAVYANTVNFELRIFFANDLGQRVGASQGVAFNKLVENPAVTALSNGNVLVTWSDRSSATFDVNDAAVLGRIYTPYGDVVVNTRKINTTTVGAQNDSSVVELSDGTLFAVYTSNNQLLGQRLSDTLVPMGDEITISNSFVVGNEVGPEVRETSDGRIVVGFAQIDSQQQTGTFYRILDPRGETINGDPNDDTIFSREDATTVNGFAGADTIVGQDSDDLIYGGDDGDSINAGGGDDTIFGGAGFDTLSTGAGADTIFAGSGADTIILASKGEATVFGGSGADELDLTGLTRSSVDLRSGTLTHDTGTAVLSSITSVKGTNSGETITGHDGDNSVLALGGVDTINGQGGADLLFGESGADVIYGGNGDDTIFGGNQGDRLFGGSGEDFIDAGVGPDELRGGEGRDTLFGGDNADTLRGGDQADFLDGGGADDSILGENGGDTIFGGGGNDTISGGRGNDQISGDEGNDTLRGGDGSDDYIFADNFGRDTITDFDTALGAEDIDLSQVTEITDFTDLTDNHMAQVGNDVVITDGNDRIVLVGIDIGDLDGTDFLF
ncbi:MAG: calcium-binding protein [Pseudomonadota bacterium]